MQMDDSSSSDDDGLPDLMQSDPDELSRIRARNFMQHMLLTTAFFGLVGTAALVGKMPREVWKIDRCSDRFYDMENSWPKYSPHLQDKLYIQHFRVDYTTFRYIYKGGKRSWEIAACALFKAAASAGSPSVGRSAGQIGRNGCLAASDPPNAAFMSAFAPHSRAA